MNDRSFEKTSPIDGIGHLKSLYPVERTVRIRKSTTDYGNEYVARRGEFQKEIRVQHGVCAINFTNRYEQVLVGFDRNNDEAR